MKSKISVVTGAHPTTKEERIKETIQYSFIFILLFVIATWLFHLTDGWLVLIIWGVLLATYCFLMYDTWTRQSTEERKVIDNPMLKK